MRVYLIRKILSIFLIVSIGYSTYAQQNSPVEMTVTSSISKNKHSLIQATVSLYNNTAHDFSGSIQIVTPAGFRSVSGNNIDVEVPAYERRFLPLNILVLNEARSGESSIQVNLTDKQSNGISSTSIKHHVKENNNIQLISNKPLHFIRDPNDSISIEATVSNLGNIKQTVSIVFNIPELTGENNFFEFKGSVGTGQDSTFIFKFLPSQSLTKLPRFTVKITGFRGKEKNLIGSFSVDVHNVASTQRYTGIQSPGLHNSGNFLTASIRSIGNNTHIYQMTGAGDVDLRNGYLSFKGNAFISDNYPLPFASNTYIAYTRDDQEFKMGNINETLEIPVFGRGARYKLSGKSDKNNITIGLIDNNFNLFDQRRLFDNGFTFFFKGFLKEPDSRNYYSGHYIIKEDTYSHARHQLLSGETQRYYGRTWNLNIKLHGGLSTYERENRSIPSFGGETQYSGNINDFRISGNHFYSTGYFPGNRRGLLQIQQSITKRTKGQHNLYTNFYITNFAPKSVNIDFPVQNNNMRWDLGIQFHLKGNWGLGLAHQLQQESSTGFYNIPGNENSIPAMSAFRLVESIFWGGKAGKLTGFLSFENGLVKYPNQENYRPQLKVNNIISYKWISLNTSYQYGSYFIAEYASTLQNDLNFERLMCNVGINKQIFSNTLLVHTSAGYIFDYQNGRNPSAVFNIRYNSKRNFSLFLNSSWFRYRIPVINGTPRTRDVVIAETGLTVKFRNKNVTAGKKSKIRGRVYYDNNTNFVFDEGDELADNYFIKFGDAAFVTNEQGLFHYKAVPFGQYTIESQTRHSWFSPKSEYNVRKYFSYIDIPIHKNGLIHGNIRYEYDKKKALDFEVKAAGIQFIITKDHKIVDRIQTDEQGHFSAYLPTGEYEISLVAGSLPENTYSKNSSFKFSVNSGQNTKIPAFSIEVKQRTINIRKFGE